MTEQAVYTCRYELGALFDHEAMIHYLCFPITLHVQSYVLSRGLLGETLNRCGRTGDQRLRTSWEGFGKNSRSENVSLLLERRRRRRLLPEA